MKNYTTMETSSVKIVEMMVISISNKVNLRTRNIIGDKRVIM